MNKPPFSFPPADFLLQVAGSVPEPPPWLRAEINNRVLLLVNHVLMQEPQAMDRLRRQKGKVVRASWGRLELVVQATPAGLLALADAQRAPDLVLQVPETSPVALAQSLLQGQRPQVDIQGDVQLAAEVAWLVDNVRWDMEEDLSRLLGDAAAHTLVSRLGEAGAALRSFLQRQPFAGRGSGASGSSGTSGTAPGGKGSA
jgi:ubiquinone biosynthesis accessory factor UbiJ